MKKKKLLPLCNLISLILIIYLLGNDPIFAQYDKKITVGISPFTGTKCNSRLILTDKVADCFASKSRFIVVDRSKMEQISNEKNLQKGGDFINGEVVEQGKSVGAQYIIAGNLGSIASNEKTKSYINPFTKQIEHYIRYEGILNFSLSVIDVVTGRSTSSKSFSLVADNNKTEEEGFAAVLNKSNDNILAWINEVFPSPIMIAEVQEKDNNGLPSIVLITAGKEMNLIEKSRLTVIEHDTMMVNGSKIARDQTLGELKVKNVENANFSICKVTDGGGKIQGAMDAKKSIELKIIKY